MKEIKKIPVGARGLVLFGSMGSWLLLLKVVFDYLKTGKVLITSYQNLIVLSFSLALLGFISGMEIHSNAPLRIRGTQGVVSFFTICTFSSALVIFICLALIIVDPDFLGWLVTALP